MQQIINTQSLNEKLVGRLFLPGDRRNVPCVIICHGAFDYKEHFFELAEYLAVNRIAALTLDMHGHGESGGRRYHVEMREWVADIRSAIGYLEQVPDVDGSRIGGFGFSSGGTAVLEAAVQGLPLKALVTLDATVRNVIKWYEVPIFKLLSGIGRIKSKFNQEGLYLPFQFALKNAKAAVDPRVNKAVLEDPYIVEAYSQMPLPGAAESFMVDTLKRIDQILCPVCVIHGAQDQIDIPRSAELLYGKLRSDKALHLLPNSGHLGHMDQDKDEFMRITLDWFLTRL